jgi:lantibiotic biosynthesis protein
MTSDRLLASHRAASFFVLRTPYLAWDDFVRWGEGARGVQYQDHADAELEHVLSEDASRLRARLDEIVARPAVREAIFLASPDLEGCIDVWRRQPTSDRGVRIERSLLRYIARMTTRSTPFGLFAGSTLGRVGTSTALRLAARSQHRRKTRIDFLYLVDLCAKLAALPELQQSLRFRPNTSLYEAGSRWHYVESTTQGHQCVYALVAVDASDGLSSALDAARDGASVSDIATHLVTDDVTLDEATNFVRQLIESQVLVPELMPALTGGNAGIALTEELSRHTAGAGAASCLAAAIVELEAIDAQVIGAVTRSIYEGVAAGLDRLPASPDISRLFQVDLTPATVEAELGPEVVAEVAAAVEMLHRITNPYDALRPFRDAFTARYDRQEVPLEEALDVEIGVGLPGIAADSGQWRDDVAWQRLEADRQTALTELLVAAAHKGESELVLTERDVTRLAMPAPYALPASFAFHGTVVAASQHAIRQGQFRIVSNGAYGPSGANLLGRFCHCDPVLEDEVRALLRREEAHFPDCIAAEVVHLPRGRDGNVLARPLLRGYEIPFLAGSGAPPERQIPVSDLLISIVGGRIVVRSARLQREILPRCSTAHNYAHRRNLPIYQFLGILQRQETAAALYWDWGALDRLPFLPRVVAGRTVLSRAQWTLSSEEVASLKGQSAVARFRQAQKLRASRSLPRYVAVAEGDNYVTADLNATLSVDMFCDMVRKKGSAVRLLEMYPDGDGLLAVGPEGRYAHEIVLPFESTREIGASATNGSLGTRWPRGDAQRRFTPTSEWTYVKLYTGVATADHVLTALVAPIVREAAASGMIDRWFFVRYTDPAFHIRLRLHGRPADIRGIVIPMIEHGVREMLESGVVARIQYDMYDRELERYGGVAGTELAERLFHADSVAVLTVLESYGGGSAPADRELHTLCGLDHLFADLGLAPGRLIAMLASVPSASNQLKRQWSTEYRRRRTDIVAALASTANEGERFHAAGAAFSARSARIAPFVHTLQQLESAGQLGVSMDTLAFSFTHMHVNRMLRTASAAVDHRLCDSVRRHHESQLARLRTPESQRDHSMSSPAVPEMEGTRRTSWSRSSPSPL